MKDCLKITQNIEEHRLLLQVFIKVNSTIIKNKVKENFSGSMERLILEIGRKATDMEVGSGLTKRGKVIMDSGSKEREKGWEPICLKVFLFLSRKVVLWRFL